MAGGTGGHIYPALAVAEVLRARGCKLYWLGSRRGMENRLVPAAGLPLLTISVTGLRGAGVLRLLAAPFLLCLAVFQALSIMLRIRPQVVLGLGGFASGPGGVAAWLTHRPLVIHEQNAIPGVTNRLLSRIATRVLEAFPHSFISATNAVFVGNPVREAIAALPAPATRGTGLASPLRVLVFGGSLGARKLNQTVPAALAKCNGPFVVHHQTGRSDDRDAIAAMYQAAGIPANVEPYIEDMAAAYAGADLVISRAGAMTIAELAAAGLPAILIPFPHAVDDHQTANARFLVDQGAALLVAESALDVDALAEMISQLASDRTRLAAMAAKAHALARTDATTSVADVCMEYCHG
ncbi:MAG: undecaprenyldiphospho-muramoylpentapeptide beta-N-acetylglucosaminyltransferase [Gammaproteobacteria bacterium]|nr:undecaprenyldiphospho-muramoylpentapeptide beta-N-acetylglucosaminyltransferase [Gammaproteobacteria bacterium]